MRYLSFDIECANCYQGRGKICSFGYVIADENFQIIEKKDIIINPNSKFNLRGRPGTPDLQLAYTQEEFKAAPKFKQFYAEIKELLEYKPQFVIGHAINNDVNFLNYETMRYKCPSFNFEYFDSQILYSEYANTGRQCGLDKIAEQFGITFLPHRADEDAYATLMYVKAIVEHYDMSLDKLLEYCDIRQGKLVNYCIYPTNSERHRMRVKKMAEEESLKNSRLSLAKFVGDQVPTLTDEGAVFFDKRIAVNVELEERNFHVTKDIIRIINQRGGTYTQHAEDCNIFVLGKNPCPRQVQIDELIAQGADVTLLTQKEFFEMLGISYQALKRRYSYNGGAKNTHYGAQNGSQSNANQTSNAQSATGANGTSTAPSRKKKRRRYYPPKKAN